MEYLGISISSHWWHIGWPEGLMLPAIDNHWVLNNCRNAIIAMIIDGNLCDRQHICCDAWKIEPGRMTFSLNYFNQGNWNIIMKKIMIG